MAVAAWITTDQLVNPLSPYAQDAVDSASFVLFMLSGRKYSGLHTTTEDYCQIGLNDLGLAPYHQGYPLLPGPSGYQVYPELEYGVLTNVMGSGCNSCGCTHLVRLRGAPVLSVASVSLGGGSPVDPGDYKIYDYSYLSTPRSTCCWKGCDDVTVTYTFGAPPPALGRLAAKALADQYILALDGSDECQLPQRVTSVSRQGMSWTLLDPQEFLDKGRTGIYQVDLFISTVNPSGAKLRARVFSPDIRRGKTPRIPQAAAPGPMAMSFGAPSPQPMLMSSPQMQGGGATVQATQFSVPATDTSASVVVTEGRPLRWVVPGSFTSSAPPVVTVQPSGEEVPPDTLLWRTNNYTLDLSADQAAQLLPPGSVLVVSTEADDGSTTGSASYPVERRA
jgi:hypothetical protein